MLVNTRFGCHQFGSAWIRSDESDPLNLPLRKLFNQVIRRGENRIDAMLGQKSLEIFPEAGAVEFRTEQVILQDHAGGVEFDIKTAASEQMNLVALNQSVGNFEPGLVAGWENKYSVHELSLEENGTIIPQFQASAARRQQIKMPILQLHRKKREDGLVLPSLAREPDVPLRLFIQWRHHLKSLISARESYKSDAPSSGNASGPDIRQ
jgi:hypothetical protein